MLRSVKIEVNVIESVTYWMRQRPEVSSVPPAG
jgi:hypothetical protein